MRVDASITIDAPKDIVAAIYADYRNWPRVFPLVRGVRLIRRDGERLVLEVDHAREGAVRNEMVIDGAGAIDLWESKRRYDARFLNRFAPTPGGTRFTIHADIRLKGAARLLRPVLASYVRRQMERWTLEPVKVAAEARARASARRNGAP
jgi:uncharacterized membrane protein